MRCAAVILALILAPQMGHAQAEGAQLSWEGNVSARAEALLVVRDIEGNQVLALRKDLEMGERSLHVEMPPLPRAAATIQAGLIDGGRVTLQSQITPISDRAANGPRLVLRARLALGFHDLWVCDNEDTLRITHQDNALHLQNADGIWRMEEDEAGADTFRAEEGAVFRLEGNDAELTAPEREATLCQPSLFRPILPLEVQARDQSWRMAMGLEEALIDPPGHEEEALRATDLSFEAPRDGAITIHNEELRLTIREDRCELDARGLPYPFSATLVHEGLDVSRDGCAGSPLRLIDGESWHVKSIFGRPLAMNGDTMPPITLQIADTQISGRGTCNRYVGMAMVEEGTLAFTELGTTRIACPAHKQNMELRFLDALEVSTSFALARDGMLILLAGHLPVLTASRR